MKLEITIPEILKGNKLAATRVAIIQVLSKLECTRQDTIGILKDVMKAIDYQVVSTRFDESCELNSLDELWELGNGYI